MKTIIALIGCSLIGVVCKSQSRDSVSLTVEITRLKKNKDFIVFAMLMNESKKVVQQKKVPSDQTDLTLVFKKLTKGKYAFRFFQDENGNGQLDFNFLGIPKESWGYSNDARGFMSAPKIEDAMVDVNASKKIIVKSVN